jgi:predicted nucleotidyltransferase
VTPATRDTAAATAFIEEAREALKGDKRIVAAWLGGSFASGKCDAWSDVDLHVAIPDVEWDSVFGERHQLLSAIRPLLGFVEMPLPWRAHLVSATLTGPVRVDLFLERLSLLESAVRREDPVVLFDGAGVTARLRRNWSGELVVRMQVEQAVRTLFFGSTWPVRLWGREEWGTMMYNATMLVYQFLVPAMIVQDDPDAYFRPVYHNERHLFPARRQVANAFVKEIAEVFAGGLPPDSGRVASLHERLIGAVWRELRGACEAWGVAYPVAAQEEMREYYQRELGIEIKD